MSQYWMVTTQLPLISSRQRSAGLSHHTVITVIIADWANAFTEHHRSQLLLLFVPSSETVKQ
eukprot:scaffold20116_cov69-Cyclotella_meneghiniana.AAC.2